MKGINIEDMDMVIWQVKCTNVFKYKLLLLKSMYTCKNIVKNFYMNGISVVNKDST